MDFKFLLVFSVMFLAYTCIVYNRQSIPYAAPVIAKGENLQNSDLGLIVSSQHLGYMIVKTVAGPMADIVVPSLLLSSSVFCTGLALASFTVASSVFMFAATSFLCGFSQGPAWGACAVLLKQNTLRTPITVDGGLPVQTKPYSSVCLTLLILISSEFRDIASITTRLLAYLLLYFCFNLTEEGSLQRQHVYIFCKLVAPEQFATWWGVLSVSSNVAGTFGPYLSASLINAYGWRSTFMAVSTTTLAYAGICFVTLRISTRQDKKAKDSGPTRRFLDVFTPQLGLVFIQYTLVSLSRGACTDWAPMYLVQNKQQSILIASSFSSTQEIGGIVGSIAAGYVADVMVSKTSSTVQPRYIINIFLTVLQTVGVLGLLCFVNAHSSQLWINFLAFLTGFGMYGAITLFGVLAMEVAPPNLAGTSHSMVMLGSNLGRVMAGYPLSLIATWMTWHESFIVVLVICLLSVLTVLLGLQYTRLTEKKNL